ATDILASPAHPDLRRRFDLAAAHRQHLDNPVRDETEKQRPPVNDDFDNQDSGRVRGTLRRQAKLDPKIENRDASPAQVEKAKHVWRGFGYPADAPHVQNFKHRLHRYSEHFALDAEGHILPLTSGGRCRWFRHRLAHRSKPFEIGIENIGAAVAEIEDDPIALMGSREVHGPG